MPAGILKRRRHSEQAKNASRSVSRYGRWMCETMPSSSIGVQLLAALPWLGAAVPSNPPKEASVAFCNVALHEIPVSHVPHNKVGDAVAAAVGYTHNASPACSVLGGCDMIGACYNCNGIYVSGILVETQWTSQAAHRTRLELESAAVVHMAA